MELRIEFATHGSRSFEPEPMFPCCDQRNGVKHLTRRVKLDSSAQWFSYEIASGDLFITEYEVVKASVSIGNLEINPLRSRAGLFRISVIRHHNLQYIVAWNEFGSDSQAPARADALRVRLLANIE